YVALSYVWGSAAGLSSTRGNIDALKRPGSLWLAQRDLPAVITDAMALVAGMGERYLWVDRLCILQDDGDTKMAAINQMDVIYENALLTIVAAEGADASAGLPGVGRRPRMQAQRCDVIGPRLKMIVPHELDALRSTKWASRAWTFQEYLASPRRLIFVNGQIAFRC
ncbi:heterokaryon incompatibility, partial [Cercophora newfieldiana]